jgi:hypothetical protein
VTVGQPTSRREKTDLLLTESLCLSTDETLESFEMWCWRIMEISWTDRVRNEEVLHRVEERIILHTIKRRKA